LNAKAGRKADFRIQTFPNDKKGPVQGAWAIASLDGNAEWTKVPAEIVRRQFLDLKSLSCAISRGFNNYQNRSTQAVV
jgi:hypothetical protein